MLDYCPKDAALLVGLDRLLRLMDGLEADADGYCTFDRRGRLHSEVAALVGALEERGWVEVHVRDGAARARVTLVGRRELLVFLRRAGEAAARARGEVVEEWRP
jgi:hypothetical protein